MHQISPRDSFPRRAPRSSRGRAARRFSVGRPLLSDLTTLTLILFIWPWSAVTSWRTLSSHLISDHPVDCRVLATGERDAYFLSLSFSSSFHHGWETLLTVLRVPRVTSNDSLASIYRPSTLPLLHVSSQVQPSFDLRRSWLPRNPPLRGTSYHVSRRPLSLWDNDRRFLLSAYDVAIARYLRWESPIAAANAARRFY